LLFSDLKNVKKQEAAVGGKESENNLFSKGKNLKP